MDIYVYIDTIKLENDTLITQLVALTDRNKVIIDFKMTDDAQKTYRCLLSDTDYILGDEDLDSYDDEGYHKCEDRIRTIFSDFFENNEFDTPIRWYIVNWPSPHDVSYVFSHIVDDGILASSVFLDINDMITLSGASSYTDETFINWIHDNKETVIKSLNPVDNTARTFECLRYDGNFITGKSTDISPVPFNRLFAGKSVSDNCYSDNNFGLIHSLYYIMAGYMIIEN
jgi:hypothetical protein